jgi:tellurite resistance protein TehA-like permease
MRIRPIDVLPRPDVFAAVMATGIVSVTAEDHRYRWISDILDVVAVLALGVMVALVLKHVRRWRFPYSLSDVDVTVRLFTFVAALAVLGARFQAHPWAIWPVAVIAWLAWIVLASLTVRSMWPHGWAGLRDRAHGVWELVSVATSGLAIITAHVALLGTDGELFAIALAVWLVAIGTYCVITWLILWRAAVAPTDDLWEPDIWILMGGLAIATLAGDRVHLAALTIVAEDWLLTAVRLVTVATWVVATLWIPALVYATSRRLHLRFTGAWWAMVFPLGMYSSATFAMNIETRWRPFQAVSLVFFWIAFGAWLAVALAAVVAFRRAQTR